MKRVVKISALVCIILVLTGLITLWAVSRWLQSEALHAQIEQELSKALRMPVKLQSVNISLLGGTKVSGISIPQPGGNFLAASGFSARHSFRSLLRGRLVLEEINLDSPIITIREDAEGKWVIPKLAVVDKPESEKHPAAKQPGSDKSAKRWDSKVQIKKVQLLNGSAQVFDVQGGTVAAFSGINIYMSTINAVAMEGRLTADKVSFTDFGTLESLKAVFSRTDKKGIILPELTAVMGGGNISGGFSQKPGDEKAWTLKLKLENVDTNQAFATSLNSKINLSGVLGGSVELRGVGKDQKLIQGKGSLLLRNGYFKEMDTIREVGLLLGLTDAANFTIADATLDAVIWNERIVINTLAINAPPLAIQSVKGKSNVKLDGKLNIPAILLVDAERLKQRPSIERQFSPPDENGRRGVEFKLGGNWKKPKNDLMERITGTKDRKMQKFILGEAILLGPDGLKLNLKSLEQPAPQPETTKP